AEVARLTGRRPPSFKIPYAAILPVAAAAEAIARLTGREPFVTLDGARMSKKKMFFSSARAVRELGYAPRPARQAIADAVAWFKANGYLVCRLLLEKKNRPKRAPSKRRPAKGAAARIFRSVLC